MSRYSIERKGTPRKVYAELILHDAEHSPSWQVCKDGTAHIRFSTPTSGDHLSLHCIEWSKYTDRRMQTMQTLSREQAIALRDWLNLLYPP